MILILGFPRCDTTWIQRMLCTLTAPVVGEPFNPFTVNIGDAPTNDETCGIVPVGLDDEAIARLRRELSRLSRSYCGVDLSVAPDAREHIREAFRTIRMHSSWAKGYKQIYHCPECAEVFGGKMCYIARRPLGVLDSLYRIVCGAQMRDNKVIWPLLLVDNIRAQMPGQWKITPGPATIWGDLARMYKIRVQNDMRRLATRGARLFWFEDLVVNHQIAWGGLLEHLGLQATPQFERMLAATLAVPFKPVRYQPELLEAVDQVFGSEWTVSDTTARSPSTIN